MNKNIPPISRDRPTAAGAIEARFAIHGHDEQMQFLKQLVLVQQAGHNKPESLIIHRPDRTAPLSRRPHESDPTTADPPVSDREIQQVVKNIQHLFTLPDHVIRIINLLRSANPSVDAIQREISKDPALAAEILKVANSGFYGFQHNIVSIQHATVILGLHVVQAIVLSVAAVSFSSLQKLWRHSLVCAHACTLLTRKLNLPHNENISVAGLLHDIGKAILLEYLGDAYAAACQRAERENILFHTAERLEIGVSHAEIGRWLLSRWNLAPETVEAIGGHHAFTDGSAWAKQTAIVHVADVLTKAIGIHSGEDSLVPPLHPQALAQLRMEPETMRVIIRDLDAFANGSS